jgi:hypothetical protein
MLRCPATWGPRCSFVAMLQRERWGSSESKILTMTDVCRSSGKGYFIFSGLQEWGMAEGLPSKPQSRGAQVLPPLALAMVDLQSQARPPLPSAARLQRVLLCKWTASLSL